MKEKEWKVTMSTRDYQYYGDQRDPKRRLEECNHGVNPVWYAVMMQKLRERERSEEYKKTGGTIFMEKLEGN